MADEATTMKRQRSRSTPLRKFFSRSRSSPAVGSGMSRVGTLSRTYGDVVHDTTNVSDPRLFLLHDKLRELQRQLEEKELILHLLSVAEQDTLTHLASNDVSMDMERRASMAMLRRGSMSPSAAGPVRARDLYGFDLAAFDGASDEEGDTSTSSVSSAAGEQPQHNGTASTNVCAATMDAIQHRMKLIQKGPRTVRIVRNEPNQDLGLKLASVTLPKYDPVAARPLFENRSAVFVKQVQPGSPSERAGLVPGDEVLELDGQSCSGSSLGTVQTRLAANSGTVTVVVQCTHDFARHSLHRKKIEIKCAISEKQQLLQQLLYEEETLARRIEGGKQESSSDEEEMEPDLSALLLPSPAGAQRPSKAGSSEANTAQLKGASPNDKDALLSASTADKGTDGQETDTQKDASERLEAEEALASEGGGSSNERPAALHNDEGVPSGSTDTQTQRESSAAEEQSTEETAAAISGDDSRTEDDDADELPPESGGAQAAASKDKLTPAAPVLVLRSGSYDGVAESSTDGEAANTPLAAAQRLRASMGPMTLSLLETPSNVAQLSRGDLETAALQMRSEILHLRRMLQVHGVTSPLKATDADPQHATFTFPAIREESEPDANGSDPSRLSEGVESHSEDDNLGNSFV